MFFFAIYSEYIDTTCLRARTRFTVKIYPFVPKVRDLHAGEVALCGFNHNLSVFCELTIEFSYRFAQRGDFRIVGQRLMPLRPVTQFVVTAGACAV